MLCVLVFACVPSYTFACSMCAHDVSVYISEYTGDEIKREVSKRTIIEERKL